MENKHTPGPWKVKHSESKPAFNVIGTQLGQTYKIARCPYYTFETVTEGNSEIVERNMTEAEANARLIAAAPGLLEEHTANTELLTGIAKELDYWADESVNGGWSTHQVDPMRKLADRIRRSVAKQSSIAKATGEKEVTNGK